MPAPPSSHPEATAVAAERATLLRRTLAQLSRREAEVFSLRYFGELSNPDIADMLGITTGAVKVALHKARTRLQAVLEGREE
jgi:RNA polymerase sigma factor (sigma-70 family)